MLHSKADWAAGAPVIYNVILLPQILCPAALRLSSLGVYYTMYTGKVQYWQTWLTFNSLHHIHILYTYMYTYVYMYTTPTYSLEK